MYKNARREPNEIKMKNARLYKDDKIVKRERESGLNNLINFLHSRCRSALRRCGLLGCGSCSIFLVVINIKAKARVLLERRY